MNSDNYEFAKSSEPQSASNYTAYTNKQWNYINDINNSVYSNNSGLSLVQWDLTSIYNSAGFSDASDLYLAVPIIMNAAFSDGAASVAPGTAAAYGLCSLKSNYQHLIHQIEIVCGGKTCEQMVPFLSVAKNFQLLSTMSATDLKSVNVSLGISETLDNERSVQWRTTVSAVAGTPQIGVGLCNNKPWDQQVSSADVPLVQKPLQNDGTVNGAIQRRVSRMVDASKAAGSSFNGIYGGLTNATNPTIMSASQLNMEIKPYYTVSNNIMTWFDVALIPLKYISDFIDKLGLVQKLDLVIRAYFNTGSLSIAVANPDTTGTKYGAISNSTFSNICPFTINHLNGTNANGGVPAAATSIVAGLFIAKSPSTNINGINLAAGNLSHAMQACRCYYSQVALDPSRALTYVRENTEKQIVYEQVLFNQYTNITAGSSYSQLVQSGIKNPISVLIVPFISTGCGTTTTAGLALSGSLGFTQYGSPFDTSPSSYAPISLTNLSVTLGGVNVLNTSLNYTFENFLSQIVTAESLTSADVGVAVGLITQSWWEQNRVYFVDLARANAADREMPRNLNISFNNNTQIPIDIMVFTIYLDKIVLNVQTGQVNKI